MTRGMGPGEDGPPINGMWVGVDGWLKSLPYDTSALAADVAWSPVFTEQPYKPGRAQLDRAFRYWQRPSWLGGPAMAPLPEWPRRPDGTPLTHVAAFSLEDIASAGQEEDKAFFPEHREGLPTNGYLEVFHDLIDTYGWEAADRATGGWLVRWVSEPQERLVDPPTDLEILTEVCQAGIFLRGWSHRSSLDFGFSHEAFEAAEAVQQAVQLQWMLQRTGAVTDIPLPFTHVYGHSQTESAPALRVLREVLPLEAGDAYRLILEIESFTHLAGWFGDSASLEVWMRESDLAARRFDQAWCITRTD